MPFFKIENTDFLVWICLLIEKIEFHNKLNLFRSRIEAGSMLGELLSSEKFDLLLAIPNGGVPVARGILNKIQIPEFNFLLIRKIQIPWNTEAGMGAVTPDGQVFLNHTFINQLNISDPELMSQINNAKNHILVRKKKYGLNPFSVKDKNIIITDDGIASGFSLIAGCTWLTQQQAKKIYIAIPTAPYSSIQTVIAKKLCDKILCLNIRDISPFAVADAYQNWYDVPDSEVELILKQLTIKKQ